MHGAHEMTRGFSPGGTCPMRRLSHLAFAIAEVRFVDSETNSDHPYVDELRDHNPFKSYKER
ncbi:peptidogalycan biosysnthesis protein [Paraburkholderia sp. RL18-103-BIB-C]